MSQVSGHMCYAALTRRIEAVARQSVTVTLFTPELPYPSRLAHAPVGRLRLTFKMVINVAK